MKLLLILLFIGLICYLIIHMCGGFSGRGKFVPRSMDDDDKHMMILDNLVFLNDRDLSRLKGEIQDLKDFLDKGRVPNAPIRERKHGTGNRRLRRREAAALVGSRLGRRELLRKIRHETRAGISNIREDRKPPSVIPKIIVLNILLLIITVLVILL